MVGGRLAGVDTVTECYKAMVDPEAHGSQPVGWIAFISLRCPTPLQMALREIHEDAPVLACHRMLPRTDVVPERPAAQFADFRHRFRLQSSSPKQAIDWLGCLEHVKLAVGVGPLVLDG